MAVTAAASRLTEAHRIAQARLGTQTVRGLLATWGLLDPENLDAGLDAWLRVAIPLVQQQRSTSATLASNYLMTFRSLELGVAGDRFIPALADAIDRQALVTSLVVTGPATLKRATQRGLAIAKAADLAKATSARAAMRHAMNGGRDTITGSVTADKAALGWARAASGRACAFCATLASRGPVYSEDTVDFECHDGCSCSVEPVYSRDADWPEGSRRYQQIWDEAKAADDPTATVFRRLIEAA